MRPARNTAQGIAHHSGSERTGQTDGFYRPALLLFAVALGPFESALTFGLLLLGAPRAATVSIFGDDSVLQFGGGTLGHPWGNAAGAAANRVSLEACVKARNEGRELEKEGKEILTDAAKHSPELKMAMETWKEIKFEFDTVDKLDVVHR